MYILDMVTSVQITPDGRATEASAEQANEEKGARIYNGAALHAQDHCQHNAIQTHHDNAGLVRLRRKTITPRRQEYIAA